MITWWPNPRGSYGGLTDHWFEENGKIFIVLTDGDIKRVDAKRDTMRRLTKSHYVIKKILPEDVAKRLANNRRESLGDTK